MKKVMSAVVWPLLLSLAALFFIKENLLSFNFKVAAAEADAIDLSEQRYLRNFSANPKGIHELLAQHGDSATIYLIGSSELTTGSPYLSYNFISGNFPVKVMGMGHEGNQCFSIYSQLLSRSAYLKDAPVVIILSPGWFEAKPSRGTTSDVYLEYMSDAAVSELQETQLPQEFRNYANRGIARFYPELNAPSAAFRLAHLSSLSEKSLYHRLWCAPLQSWNNLMNLFRLPLKKHHRKNAYQAAPVFCSLNIDSLLMSTKALTLAGATNNTMGIENSYFSQYVGEKRGRIYTVSDIHNRELQDCRMLIQMLKAANAHASFVISPLNPYYFRNLRDLDPVISAVEHEIKEAGFNALNLYTSDTTTYDKALLGDIMHMSHYGWMQVNKFIIHEYQLCQ